MRNFMEVAGLTEQGYMNADEVSRYLGVKRSTIYQWAKEGKIPAYKVGRMWRFKKEEIDEWMESHRENGIVADRGARRIFENVKGLKRRPKENVGAVVSKAIEEMRRNNYNESNGNQIKIEGLRKEVKDGNL